MTVDELIKEALEAQAAQAAAVESDAKVAESMKNEKWVIAEAERLVDQAAEMVTKAQEDQLAAYQKAATELLEANQALLALVQTLPGSVVVPSPAEPAPPATDELVASAAA